MHTTYKSTFYILLLLSLATACSNNPEKGNAAITSEMTITETVFQATNTPMQIATQEITPLINTVTITLNETVTNEITAITQTVEESINPSPTPQYIPRCNNASYVADVTIPDGTIMKPGERFDKIWRLKNTGDCLWTASYTLGFGYGNPLGGIATTINKVVKPGETVDISIGMIAPMEKGWYAGWWRMKSETGENFGEFVFVSIQVENG